MPRPERLRSRNHNGEESERGSATVTAAATILALLVVFSGLLLVAGALGARGLAQTAADLGALAAARILVDGGGDPCGRAATVVGANGARLESCVIEGVTVVVSASRPVQWAGRPTEFTASAVARAGPVLGA